MNDAPPPELPQTPSFRLDGRRALVTGAGRGIGLGAAAALTAAGARVTLLARGAAEIETAAEAIRAAGGEADTIRPLTDLSMNSAADGGVPRVLELVFPRDVAGVEEGAQVTLQYGVTGPLAYDNEETWRLTEVPVEA